LPNIVDNIDEKCIQHVGRMSFGGGGAVGISRLLWEGNMSIDFRESIMKLGTSNFHTCAEHLY
jgi:hypothetical protein